MNWNGVQLNIENDKLSRTTINYRKSEALAKIIGETLIDTVVIFDDQGCILSVNPAVKAIFGYEPEELIGRHIVILFQKIDKENSDETFLTSMKLMVGKVIESVALHKEESYFPADIQMGKTTVEGQQIFVCTIRDVTERKQLEEDKKQKLNCMEYIVEERTLELLRANEKLQNEIEEKNKIAQHLFLSQERFRKIFESSPCLMAILSLKESTILDVNTSWFTFTGYSFEDLENRKINLEKFVDETDGSHLNLNEKFHNRKITYKTKNGQDRVGLLSTEKIDIDSEPCILVVLNDITERVNLEKEMYRLDRLNLIGEMAAGIAHEIRNPMTTVHGFLQLTRNDKKQLPLEIVELMIEELNRANSIITEFLNLAKNKVSVKIKQNLNTIIETIYPLIQAEAIRSSKSIKLDLNLCPDIYLDQKEIRQLILNIALNGLDAMGNYGNLILRTFTEKQAVILEIKDQGKGISPDIMGKLGTPFFTTKENGTGLGLAICYSVAERNNAEIAIETGNEGTTFVIRFSTKQEVTDGDRTL